MLQSAIGKARSERERDGNPRLLLRGCAARGGGAIRALRRLGGANAIGIAMTRTEQLHRVGRERARAIETAVHYPRMFAILCNVLAAHHDSPAARMAGDMVVDVLRRVGLVVRDECASAKS